MKPFPTGAGKWMVSRDGGDWPVWSRGGDRLFFLDTKGVMEVEVVAEPSLRFGRPRRLFEYPFPLVQVPLGESRGFDVDPDGTRFLMVVPTDPDAPAPALQVVQNWSAEFK